MPPIRPAMAAALLGLTVVLAGCDRAAAPGAGQAPAEPVRAVERLVDDLRRDDLAGYARHAVPPELHQRLELAWREGRTVWPLTELPLDARFQGFLVALAAPGSEQALLAAYRSQFAGAHAEIGNAATALGLFARQYVSREASYSAAERDHYTQLVAALGQWGRGAPLGDPERARRAVPQLALAARATGLGTPAGLREAGMERSLQRLGPFAAWFEHVLAGYGLDFDQALGGLRASLVEQAGDRARVRVQYTLAGQPIDAEVLLERHAGRWYLGDLLRRAESEAAAAPPAAQP